MLDVLLASHLPGASAASHLRRSASLRSSVSVAASTTKSQAAKSSGPEAHWMRASSASRASAAILPFSTCLPRAAATRAFPRWASSSAASTRTTVRPQAAATCAMPLPICPAPTTPKVRTRVSSPGPAEDVSSRFAMASPSVAIFHRHTTQVARSRAFRVRGPHFGSIVSETVPPASAAVGSRCRRSRPGADFASTHAPETVSAYPPGYRRAGSDTSVTPAAGAYFSE